MHVWNSGTALHELHRVDASLRSLVRPRCCIDAVLVPECVAVQWRPVLPQLHRLGAVGRAASAVLLVRRLQGGRLLGEGLRAVLRGLLLSQRKRTATRQRHPLHQ